MLSTLFEHVGIKCHKSDRIDPNNGKVLRRGDFIAASAPIQILNQLYFGTANGEIVATDKNLNIEKRVKISEAVISSVIQYKNVLAIGTTNGVVSLVDPISLKVVNQFSFGHAYSAIFGDLFSLDNYLAILSSRNRLFVFKKI
jgi:hypothetical protein